ncbi:hypothetical protein NKJ46_10370 [Mesorhizobium sp. M0166]|uniref:hypothetical protein n=1 Tax=unclassified Mesorhizobium TaxID=325217 RepID=UPI003339F49A
MDWSYIAIWRTRLLIVLIGSVLVVAWLATAWRERRPQAAGPRPDAPPAAPRRQVHDRRIFGRQDR